MTELTPQVTIIRAFESAAEPGRKKKPFLVGPKILTYGELDDRARRLTHLFHESGLEKGDRVILALKEDVDLVTVFLSLLRNGITAVVLDPDLKKQRFQTIYNTAKPCKAILDEELLSRLDLGQEDVVFTVPSAAHTLPTLFDRLMGRGRDTDSRKTPLAKMLEGIPKMAFPSEIDPEQDAYVLFTSGSTSAPKGVRLSHHNLMSHLQTLARVFGYNGASRILNILTLHHTDGLIHGPVAAFVNGAEVHRPFRFEVSNIPTLLDSVYTNRITHFISVPTMLALIDRMGTDYLDSFDTDDFVAVVSSAAPLEKDLQERFESNFGAPVVNVYGLTETVVGGLFSGPSPSDKKTGTVGRAVDCRVRLVDADGSDVKPGEVGELLINGDMVFKGYLNAEEATREVLRDGWFSTGDLFKQDDDGFYVAVGRKKTLIISGGFNVFPDEVTEILNQVPAVAESVTFGMPDDIWGERVVSGVVIKPEASADTEPIFEYLRSHLERQKVPAEVRVVDSIPRTSSGKIDVAEVKRMVSEGKQNGPGGTRGDIADRVLAVAAALFNVPIEDLSGQSSPGNTKAWDSLAHLGLVVAAEKEFDVALSTNEVMQIENLSILIEIIKEKV